MALAALTRPLALNTRSLLPIWTRFSRAKSTNAAGGPSEEGTRLNDTNSSLGRGAGEKLDPLPDFNNGAPWGPGEVPEALFHGSLVHGRSALPIFLHPKTHGVPMAVLHFRSHHISLLKRFTGVALHAAAALGIPASQPAMLPTQRTLWTVPKSPFVHKGAQENFERKVHKRAIKVWDADPEVVERWIRFLDAHSEGGVGLRVVRWDRAPVGVGREALRRVDERLMLKKGSASIKRLGEKIVEAEGGVPAKDNDVKISA